MRTVLSFFRPILTEIGICWQILVKKCQILNFTKILPVTVALFHVGRKDGRTDIMTAAVTIRFWNAPDN